MKLVGDFERAAAAKGEDEDAKASKPVRFVPVGVAVADDEGLTRTTDDVLDEANAENPFNGVWLPLKLALENEELVGEAAPEPGRVELGVVGGLGLDVDADGGVDLLPKIDGPFAEANGDEVAA